MSTWLYEGMTVDKNGVSTGEMLRTVADVQKKYGRPATTRTVIPFRPTWETRGRFVYIYHNLTTETEHSGQVDSTTTFYFHGSAPTDVATGVVYTP